MATLGREDSGERVTEHPAGVLGSMLTPELLKKKKPVKAPPTADNPLAARAQAIGQLGMTEARIGNAVDPGTSPGNITTQLGASAIEAKKLYRKGR